MHVFGFGCHGCVCMGMCGVCMEGRGVQGCDGWVSEVRGDTYSCEGGVCVCVKERKREEVTVRLHVGTEGVCGGG